MAMKSRSYVEPALRVTFLLVIAWVLIGYTQYASVAPPSFDGAMNLNTALSFAEGRGYGFFYSEFFPFPAQTDGPLTLPAGLLMRLGGVSPLTTQGVNLGYLIGTVIVGYMLMRRITRSPTFALAGTAILLMTPGVFGFSMGGYGEVICIFWLLVSLLVLAPALDSVVPSPIRLTFGGVALALGFLTKTVALLLVAPALVLFAIIFVVRHPRHALFVSWLLAGLVLPILAWEVFRLLEIGSVDGYVAWWNSQFGQTLLQSGATETLQANRGPVAKGLQHLDILAGLVATPPAALAVFLLVPWLVIPAILVDRWQQRDFGNVFCIATCTAISVLYFVWWLIIEQTSMAWLRRIVDGLMLQQIVAVVVLVALIRACRRTGKFATPRRLVAACLLVMLIFSGSFLLANGETLTDPPAATAADRDTLALAKKIQNLPADATLFGFGWWKNPVLALFSGRPMMNFYYWDPAKIDALSHKYLIVDMSAKALDQQDVQAILAAGTSHVIADGPGGAIYELDKVLPYKPFAAADFDPGKLRPGFVAGDGAYPATRGFYPAEGRAAWVRPEAGLVLRRTDQNKLSLSIYAPPELVAEDPGKPLLLHVESPNCIDMSVPIESGVRTIVLPLSCAPSASPEPMGISLFVNGRVPNVRQIDADHRRLAYLMTDIHLQGP